MSGDPDFLTEEEIAEAEGRGSSAGANTSGLGPLDTTLNSIEASFGVGNSLYPGGGHRFHQR